MTSRIGIDEADRALKEKHRGMWALGDYPAVASEVIPELGPVLVEACGIRDGDRVLDVGAGSGNAAIPAAMTGARVIASDLTPELFEPGQAAADRLDVELEWQQADAEALPYDDGEFDKVISCVGVMFAPHHQQSADELVRVCRPGGTIGLINWTPGGFIGQMFATMRPFSPPPPVGASPPPLWGDEDHVRELFGDRVTDLRMERREVRIGRFGNAEAFRDFFKKNYGPTIAVYRNLGFDTDKVVALDADLVELGRGFGADEGTMNWEYLLVTATRR